MKKNNVLEMKPGKPMELQRDEQMPFQTSWMNLEPFSNKLIELDELPNKNFMMLEIKSMSLEIKLKSLEILNDLWTINFKACMYV